MKVTTKFAKDLIRVIETKLLHGSMGFYIPDRFKAHWIERVFIDYEATVDQCTLDSDGLWVLNEPNHNNHLVKFFWRIEPNYCTAGRPLYDTDMVNTIFNNSEHKKSILKFKESEVCLEWFGFNPPTDTCWGLRKKPTNVTIYHNGTQIFCVELGKGWKKQLTEFIEEYYAWEKYHF